MLKTWFITKQNLSLPGTVYLLNLCADFFLLYENLSVLKLKGLKTIFRTVTRLD